MTTRTEREYIPELSFGGCARMLLLAASLLLCPMTGLTDPIGEPVHAPTRSAYALYRSGRLAEAGREYEREVSTARESGSKKMLWNALMARAWFEDARGNHDTALQISQEALQHASELKDEYRIGRSLIWTGLSLANQGLYSLALQIFNEAIEIGAPEGTIKIVPVWGFALQEKGHLFLRMGELDKAERYIGKTTRYARKHSIQVGVAEGGAYLAEIALAREEIASAVLLADESLEAAKACDCSPLNLARSQVVRARIELVRFQDGDSNYESALALIDDALEYSKRYSLYRFLAEAQLLKSKIIPGSQFQERYDLALSALESLTQSGSELRGMAESGLAAVLSDQEEKRLAQTLLEHGLKVSTELLRNVDRAYILADIAKLKRDDTEDESMALLAEAADAALESGLYPFALKNQMELIDALVTQGYYSLAAQWTQKAIDTADSALALNISQSAARSIRHKKMILVQTLLELELRLRSTRDLEL